ncbi:MAG: dethiobiotin synthase [Planctomycetota bacterium]|nr:dethiobiotin synthase [Planctomycetota bacterium]
MERKRPGGLFITGSDTNVGKTYITALIARQLRAAGHSVGVYKPAASGCKMIDGQLVSEDAVALWEAAGRPGELRHVCPQLFAAPLAPHLAARAEGRSIDCKLLRSGIQYWESRSEIILVEGAGGLISPIGDTEYVADLAYEFGYPLIVVVANRIGAINQALQTLIAARSFRGGLTVAGVILNEVVAHAGTPDQITDPSFAANGAELQLHTDVPLLAEVRAGQTSLPHGINWFDLASRECATGSASVRHSWDSTE